LFIFGIHSIDSPVYDQLLCCRLFQDENRKDFFQTKPVLRTDTQRVGKW